MPECHNIPLQLTDFPVDIEDYATNPLTFLKFDEIFRLEALSVLRNTAAAVNRAEFKITNQATGRSITFDVENIDGTNLRIDHLVTGSRGTREVTEVTNSMKYFVANEIELPHSHGVNFDAPRYSEGILSLLFPQRHPKPVDDQSTSEYR